MKPFYSPSNFSARQKREHAERFLQSYGNDHNVRFVFEGPARTDGKTVWLGDYDPDDEKLHVDMTLTAPGCPAADFIMEDVRQKLLSVVGPKGVDLRLVFEPEWNKDMMSEEAKLELGFL